MHASAGCGGNSGKGEGGALSGGRRVDADGCSAGVQEISAYKYSLNQFSY
jgi:hypothetical protein